jgi:hypothetical protein
MNDLSNEKKILVTVPCGDDPYIFYEDGTYVTSRYEVLKLTPSFWTILDGQLMWRHKLTHGWLRFEDVDGVEVVHLIEAELAINKILA